MVIESLCRGGCGILPTASPSVKLFRFNESIPRQPKLYGPCLVVIVQGEKAARLAGTDLIYNEQKSLLVTGDLPLECVFSASINSPLVGVILAVEPDDIKNFAKLLCNNKVELGTADVSAAALARPVTTSQAMFELLDRVLMHLASPMTAELFVPSTIRELLFQTMSAMDPVHLAANYLDGPLMRISAVLRRITFDLEARPSVPQLAQDSGMSVSSFQRHFRAYTGHSPAQFVRTVRLTRAKALLETRQGSVKAIALAVGYDSVSRFSNDYRTLFGFPPSKTPEV